MLDAATLDRWFPSVRRHEQARFLFFSSLFALITFAQTIGLAASEALFLARRGPGALPLAFVLASGLTVACSLAYALVVGRARNSPLFIQMLIAASLALLGLGALAWTGSEVAPIGLFCAFFVFQAILVNLHYWTFASDFFDALTSKRLFPLLAVGSSAGGVAGGLLTVAICAAGPVELLIGAWMLGLVAAAGLLIWGRDLPLRWSPVGVEEADESSAKEVREALRYLSRSALARWLVVSVVGMVFSLFVMQFLYSRAFAESLGSAQRLASFFGLYLALTNGIEIAVSRSLTPRLIARFGVAKANLVHPLLTMVTFVALALDPRIYTAVLARMNRELLENALAMPIRSLSYNALPFRFRGRMRALLEGIVSFATMSIAGGALILLGTDNLEPLWLCIVGGGATLLYIAANLRVRHEYLQSLLEQIRSGRIDWDEVVEEIGRSEVAGLAEQFRLILDDPEESPTAVVLQLARLLGKHGFTEELHHGATHRDPRVRIACLNGLALEPIPSLIPLIVTCLGDDEASVRLAAARAAAADPAKEHAEPLQRALRERELDPDSAVRAEAALQLGAEGSATLVEMAGSSDSAVAIDALNRVPLALADIAQRRSRDQHPGVRAAAISCLTRVTHADGLSATRLHDDLGHPDARVRRAAAEALGAQADPSRAPVLATALDDVAREVRAAASKALSQLGEAGMAAAAALIDGTRMWTVDAALSTVASAGTPASREILERAFRDRVIDAWRSLVALNVLASDGRPPSRFLHVALGNAVARSQGIAFRVLELIADPTVVRSVAKGLRVLDSRLRANALEALSHLGEHKTAQLLVLLLEPGPLEGKLSAVDGIIPIPSDPDEALRQLQHSSDRWIKLAATNLLKGADADDQEVQTMKGLLALRNVSLFKHLTLEQLEVINQMTREDSYLAGDTVVREGDPGDDLYIVLEGEVRYYQQEGRVFKGAAGPGSYFGEIAIFDNAKRTATVTVAQDARLLKLEGDRFKQLIAQTPEISFEIFHVLTARLRAAEERVRVLAEQTRAAPERPED